MVHSKIIFYLLQDGRRWVVFHQAPIYHSQKVMKGLSSYSSLTGGVSKLTASAPINPRAAAQKPYHSIQISKTIITITPQQKQHIHIYICIWRSTYLLTLDTLDLGALDPLR